MKSFNKKNKELISIIIPCFNGGVFLERSINSAINQTWGYREIVLVDDGSTDKITLEIIAKFKDLPDINVIKQKNNGLPNARNKGGQNAKGEYLYFLDSDDWIEPDAIELMLCFLKNNDDAAYVFSDIVLEGEVNKTIKKEYNFFEQLFLNQLPYSIFIKKDLWLKFGGYDEEMKSGYEDWEFNIRLGSFEKFGKRLAKPLFHYNVSYGGMLISNSSKKHSKIWKYIVLKNKRLYKLENIYNLWKKWRVKKSSYPLLIYFLWYFFFKSVPDRFASRIFIIFRNWKWTITRK